jgi:carboxymethylenebutenolidase
MTASSNGFAAAAQPIPSHTIHTDTGGLVAGMIDIPTADRSIPAYRAQPEGEGPFPIVLVIMEIFGLHEYIKDTARRIAKKGYLAIAPDIFVRAGDPSQMTDFTEIREKIIAPTPDSQILSDLDASVAWAAREGKGDPGRLGITGFCWGGRTVWLYAAHNPQLKAGVAWYGRLDSERTANQPIWPIDVADKLHTPVLGLYGGQDGGIPVELVERMNAKLKEAGSPSYIHLYPDAGHAFHADYRLSYNEADARDGEARMYSWFAENGVV